MKRKLGYWFFAQRAVAYVSAELHAFEGDLCEFGVGLVECGLEIGACGGDGENAASGGDDLSVFESSTGVKDYYVFGGLIACGLIVF